MVKPFFSHFSMGLMYRKFPEFSDFRIHKRLDRPLSMILEGESHGHFERAERGRVPTSGVIAGHTKACWLVTRCNQNLESIPDESLKRNAFSTLWKIINSDALKVQQLRFNLLCIATVITIHCKTKRKKKKDNKKRGLEKALEFFYYLN